MKKTEEEEAAAETSQWISKYLTHTHRMMWARERVSEWAGAHIFTATQWYQIILKKKRRSNLSVINLVWNMSLSWFKLNYHSSIQYHGDVEREAKARANKKRNGINVDDDDQNAKEWMYMHINLYERERENGKNEVETSRKERSQNYWRWNESFATSHANTHTYNSIRYYIHMYGFIPLDIAIAIEPLESKWYIHSTHRALDTRSLLDDGDDKCVEYACA